MRRCVVLAVAAIGCGAATSTPPVANKREPTSVTAQTSRHVKRLYVVPDGTVVTIEGAVRDNAHGLPPMNTIPGKVAVRIRVVGMDTDEVVFADRVPSCATTVIFTGTVVVYRGPTLSPKGGRIYEPRKEWDLDVDTWACR